MGSWAECWRAPEPGSTPPPGGCRLLPGRLVCWEKHASVFKHLQPNNQIQMTSSSFQLLMCCLTSLITKILVFFLQSGHVSPCTVTFIVHPFISASLKTLRLQPDEPNGKRSSGGGIKRTAFTAAVKTPDAFTALPQSPRWLTELHSHFICAA